MIHNVTYTCTNFDTRKRYPFRYHSKNVQRRRIAEPLGTARTTLDIPHEQDQAQEGVPTTLHISYDRRMCLAGDNDGRHLSCLCYCDR